MEEINKYCEQASYLFQHLHKTVSEHATTIFEEYEYSYEIMVSVTLVVSISVFIGVLKPLLISEREDATLKIKELYIFPIKSILPAKVNSAIVTERGLENDRNFCLVTPGKEKREDWNVHSINKNPRNSTIKPSLDCQGIVTLTSPYVDEELKISLNPDTEGLETLEIDMYKTSSKAFDMGDKISEWFTKACGVESRLVYMDKSGGRLSLSKHAQNKKISFGAISQYLITNSASHQDFAQKLGTDLDIVVLRPNIHLEPLVGDDGQPLCKAWAEDYWKRLEFTHQENGTKTRFELESHCARCPSLDIDIRTGKRDYKDKSRIFPLKELRKNMNRPLDKGLKGPTFGRYAHCNDIGNQINVGDIVSVQGRNKNLVHLHWKGLTA